MERDHVKAVSNASTIDSFKYMMQCVKPNICFTVRIMSRYFSIFLLEIWADVKYILKYL